MTTIPATLKYSEDHEWVSLKDGIATVGITHHAQDQLGDVVYLGEFPDIGAAIERGDPVGVVESVKATSDIFAPLSGSIVEINADLIESPELVNSDPYGEGWILRLKLQDQDEVVDLLDADSYEDILD